MYYLITRTFFSRGKSGHSFQQNTTALLHFVGHMVAPQLIKYSSYYWKKIFPYENLSWFRDFSMFPSKKGRDSNHQYVLYCNFSLKTEIN